MGSSQSTTTSNSSNNAENFGSGNFDAFIEEKKQVRLQKIAQNFIWLDYNLGFTSWDPCRRQTNTQDWKNYLKNRTFQGFLNKIVKSFCFSFLCNWRHCKVLGLIEPAYQCPLFVRDVSSLNSTRNMGFPSEKLSLLILLFQSDRLRKLNLRTV